MRARDAILAMVLAACSEPAPMVCTPGESRACACPTGATGAQICADDGSRLGECVCADLDGGGGEMDAGVHEHDAGSDAGAPARDAGQDAGPPDAGRDAGPRDAGPPDTGPVDAGPPWGECWLAPQAGCPEGYTCRVHTYDDAPHCEPHGPPGTTTCDLRAPDRCPRGHVCWAGYCRAYCDPGAMRPCPYESTPECRTYTREDGHSYSLCQPRS